MIFYLVLIVLINVYSTASLKLPSYIKPCSRKDPNFNACATQNARDAIPGLLHGDRKLGIPSFTPFKITHVDLFGGDNLKLALNNLTVYGLETTEILDIKVDFNTRKVTIKSYIGKLEVISDYEISGRILFLPLQGTGPCKLSLVDGSYEYNFIFDIEMRNGKKHGKINNALSTYDYDIKKGIFDLQNLFNGNKRLGDETNRLLSENWPEVNQELMPSISQSLIEIHGTIANIICKNVPLDELVLP